MRRALLVGALRLMRDSDWNWPRAVNHDPAARMLRDRGRRVGAGHRIVAALGFAHAPIRIEAYDVTDLEIGGGARESVPVSFTINDIRADWHLGWRGRDRREEWRCVDRRSDAAQEWNRRDTREKSAKKPTSVHAESIA